MRKQGIHWTLAARALNAARKAPGVRRVLEKAREQWIEETDEFVVWLT